MTPKKAKTPDEKVSIFEKERNLLLYGSCATLEVKFVGKTSISDIGISNNNLLVSLSMTFDLIFLQCFLL